MSVEVIIVGGGPVGLTLANLLGRRGVQVAVFEKQAEPYALPRAIHFDGEVMRCFQAAGLAEDILPHTHVGKGMLFQTPDGETLVDWSRAQEIGPMGWYESYRFFQPGVEAAMRAGLDRYPNVTLTRGAEVVGVDGARVTLGDGTVVEGRFVVAADGASSPVRQGLGIALQDLGFQERWLVVDVRLTRPRPDLGDYSIQVCDLEAPATYVRGVGDWRRWEMRLGPNDPDPMPPDLVWAKLTRWITPDDAVLERGAVYTFRSRIAEAWQAGPVLLAGDAAHQMPPFMGQGMCAGIRDVANLWWKLLAVLNGADDALLATYQTEREANARAFIEKSVALGQLINQTAAGQVPQGKMASIWPDLGPGLGPRDGAGGGRLVPQPILADGHGDDLAEHQFYALGVEVPGMQSFEGDVPLIVRPDGYSLDRVSDASIALATELNGYLASRSTFR